jgi:hypothetical protein
MGGIVRRVGGKRGEIHLMILSGSARGGFLPNEEN